MTPEEKEQSEGFKIRSYSFQDYDCINGQEFFTYQITFNKTIFTDTGAIEAIEEALNNYYKK